MEMLLRRLALAVGVVCGLIATQAPEFAQQYRQRLAGAVDELSRVVKTFDAEARLSRLKDAQSAYTDSSPVRRLVGVYEGADVTTARRAWSDFQPAIPTTLEALIVGLIGLVLGWAVTHIVVWPARRRLARRRQTASA
jgi:Protein of unknown function (DUF2937)